MRRSSTLAATAEVGPGPDQPGPVLPEDRLSTADFQRIAATISQAVGIHLTPAKQQMVEGRLRRRLRATGHDSFHAYCRFLFEGGGLDAELPYLINAITTNKTDFFREKEHFRLLATHMVPALLARRSGEALPLLKCWSAASSTGAEAYTLAMVLSELQQQSRSFRYAVLGTDVSTDVLDQAERAVFAAEMAADIPPALQERYLLQARPGLGRRDVRIVPELRRHVRFSRLNLMDASCPVDRDVDVIFLRNVLIYFDRPVQAAVTDRMIRHLRPGGYLVLGMSDLMAGNKDAVRQIAPSVFEKR